MGKMKKVRATRGAIKVPLEAQLSNENLPKKRNKEPKIRFRQESDESVLDGKTTRKILHQASAQLVEEEEDNQGTSADADFMSERREQSSSYDSNDDTDEDGDDNDEVLNNAALEAAYQCPEVNEDDEKAFDVFMSKNCAPTRTLADVIKEKITEKQTEIKSQLSDGDGMQIHDIDPKIVEMYLGVKEVLKKYRSGMLPKAFKIIPNLTNWEQILYVTDPNGWSAAAVYQGTRIFASNLREKMAQRFYNLVLLPRIRDDIAEYKRLNFHLYQALRKALFKPGAFMKGIVIPLCEGGCTLREAIIVGSVVAKNSIPMLHSAATMLRLAEMEYNGPTSIFLRILFDKKYALPYRVIDAVVFHFLRFERDDRELPVLWHQALLTFVERYRRDISSEQKEALLKLLKSQCHHAITPNIRRQLEGTKCRDEESTATD